MNFLHNVQQQGAQKPKGPLEALRPKLQVFNVFHALLTISLELWMFSTLHCWIGAYITLNDHNSKQNYVDLTKMSLSYCNIPSDLQTVINI